MPSIKNPGLAALDARFRRGTRLAIARANRPLAARTRRAAPVRTGAMAASVVATPVRTRNDVDSGRVVIADPAGVHEEYGTADQPPHPFFRPSIAAEKPAMRTTTIQTVRSSL